MSQLSLHHVPKTETERRCERCERRHTRCELPSRAMMTACAACKQGRVSCSLVPEYKKEIYKARRRPKRSVNGTRTNAPKKRASRYPLPAIKQEPEVTAASGHPCSVLDGSSDPSYGDWRENGEWRLPLTPTVASQRSGYQSTGTSSSPTHSYISQPNISPIMLGSLQIDNHIPSDGRSKILLKCGRCTEKNLECDLPPASTKLRACSACRQSRVRCERTVVTGPTGKADPFPKGGVLMVFDDSPPQLRELSDRPNSKLSSNHATGIDVASDCSIRMPDEGSEQACSPTATASSLDSGYQSVGGTLIPHSPSREILTDLTEGARQLSKVYGLLPPTFRKQSTTFEVNRGVVIATNDEGKMWYSEHWQERDPNRLWGSSQEPGSLDPLPEGLANLQLAVDEAGCVHAHHGSDSYFSTLWRPAVLSRALDDTALSDFSHSESEQVACSARWSDYPIPSTSNSSKSNDPKILDDSIMSAQMYR